MQPGTHKHAVARLVGREYQSSGQTDRDGQKGTDYNRRIEAMSIDVASQSCLVT